MNLVASSSKCLLLACLQNHEDWDIWRAPQQTLYLVEPFFWYLSSIILKIWLYPPVESGKNLEREVLTRRWSMKWSTKYLDLKLECYHFHLITLPRMMHLGKKKKEIKLWEVISASIIESVTWGPTFWGFCPT